MSSGIYIIRNVKTGKAYIGQARDIAKRWRQHVGRLELGYHHNHNLQHAWAQDGAASFTFDVLEHCAVDCLTEREQHYLDIYMPQGICYNATGTARTPSNGSENYRPKTQQENSIQIADDELLTLLNEHKHATKVADILNIKPPTLLAYLRRNGFEKTVITRWVEVSS